MGRLTPHSPLNAPFLASLTMYFHNGFEELLLPSSLLPPTPPSHMLNVSRVKMCPWGVVVLVVSLVDTPNTHPSDALNDAK